jgi:Asp-tRNA(Asn)/Glu-tRNA(Gln) amidotransferase A subunit family amidase
MTQMTQIRNNLRPIYGDHMNNITLLSATELAQKLRQGELSACDAVEAHIARIEEVNPALNALVMPLFEQARQEAAAADAAHARGDSLGPLHGVPVTIKDQFDVKGLPTTFGVARLKDNVAATDGPMVTALRRAGAIILGKTNVPQTLVCWETDNTLFGRANNPWDPERTPGGSSGGEGAIIAAGGSPLGLSGDLGGSLRIPAAWCGICGLKPTARRLPIDAAPIRTASGLEGIVAQAGPMARSVADLTLAMRVMVDHMIAHPTGSHAPAPFREPDKVDVSRLRIALLPQVGGWRPSPAIRRALQEAAAALQAQGAIVEEWTAAPDTLEGAHLLFKAGGTEGFGWLKQILGDERPIPLVKPLVQLTSMPNTVIPLVAGLMGWTGQGHLSSMLRSAHARRGDGLMDVLGDRIAYERRFLEALDQGGFDVVLCPALPLPAVRHGDTAELADFAGSAFLFNILGMPAGAVPITKVRPGEESDRPASKDKAEQRARAAEQGSAGLPIAVQVAARHWREDIVLAVMAALERDFRRQPDYPARPPL